MSKTLNKMIFASIALQSKEMKVMNLLSLAQGPLAVEVLRVMGLLSQITLNALNKSKNN